MTCRDVTDFLDAYLARDLATDVQTAFDGHLALCANCRQFLTQYEQTVVAGRTCCTDDDTPMPEELVRAILDSIQRAP